VRSLVFPTVFTIAVLIALVVFVVWMRSWRERRAREEDELRKQQQEAIRAAIEKQVLLPDGRPACVVCKSMEATETWPVVDTSWLDKITAFKELYALTPRYEVRDGEGERYQLLLCPPHKRMCIQKWREVIASKRTKVQQMLSHIEAEIAQLQGGAMLAWLQQEHELSMNRLRNFMGSTAAVPQLTANAGDDGPISMPPMSTKADTSEETPIPDDPLHPLHQNGNRSRPTDDG
jgi:hypothetical protein